MVIKACTQEKTKTERKEEKEQSHETDFRKKKNQELNLIIVLPFNHHFHLHLQSYLLPHFPQKLVAKTYNRFEWGSCTEEIFGIGPCTPTWLQHACGTLGLSGAFSSLDVPSQKHKRPAPVLAQIAVFPDSQSHGALHQLSTSHKSFHCSNWQQIALGVFKDHLTITCERICLQVLFTSQFQSHRGTQQLPFFFFFLIFQSQSFLFVLTLRCLSK